ncbi:hypothetical protein DFH28DRAFT_1136201 [Melampsora americana]|nr:hypothetical protein DFH28DRAFT_1136201 [Melampsora americana]
MPLPSTCHPRSCLSSIPSQMVNRKLSHHALAARGRIDHMTRVLRNWSYQPLLAPGNGPAGTLGNCSCDLSPTLPPLPAASATGDYSLLGSPSKEPNQYPLGIVTPSLGSLLGSSGPGSDHPTPSQSSSGGSFNPHVNPFLFDVSRSSQGSTCGTAATSASTGTYSSPLKRGASQFDAPGCADTESTILGDPACDDGSRQSVAPLHAPTPNAPPSLAFLRDEDRTFHVYFNIWQQQVPDGENVFVNGSPLHKANNKITITNPHNFQEFVFAALSAPANTTMGCRILHKDPRKTELAIRLLMSVGKSGGDGGDSDESDGHETEGSVGRFEKDFKAGENVTSVTNPKDPSQILLNTSRIHDWANDWADGVRGVDEVNPPMGHPGFRWINVCDYEKAKNKLLGLTPAVATTAAATPSGTVIHHNYVMMRTSSQH